MRVADDPAQYSLTDVGSRSVPEPYDVDRFQPTQRFSDGGRRDVEAHRELARRFERVAWLEAFGTHNIDDAVRDALRERCRDLGHKVTKSLVDLMCQASHQNALRTRGGDRACQAGAVSTSGPSGVTAIVCSEWAPREPSLLRNVQPSGSV